LAEVYFFHAGGGRLAEKDLYFQVNMRGGTRIKFLSAAAAATIFLRAWKKTPIGYQCWNAWLA
jgi:hypothetical protein